MDSSTKEETKARLQEEYKRALQNNAKAEEAIYRRKLKDAGILVD